MILTAYYMPHSLDPRRQHALVDVLTKDETGYTVRGYDHTTWHANFDELEALVKEEEDDEYGDQNAPA